VAFHSAVARKARRLAIARDITARRTPHTYGAFSIGRAKGQNVHRRGVATRLRCTCLLLARDIANVACSLWHDVQGAPTTSPQTFSGAWFELLLAACSIPSSLFAFPRWWAAWFLERCVLLYTAQRRNDMTGHCVRRTARTCMYGILCARGTAFAFAPCVYTGMLTIKTVADTGVADVGSATRSAGTAARLARPLPWKLLALPQRRDPLSNRPPV